MGRGVICIRDISVVICGKSQIYYFAVNPTTKTIMMMLFGSHRIADREDGERDNQRMPPPAFVSQRFGRYREGTTTAPNDTWQTLDTIRRPGSIVDGFEVCTEVCVHTQSVSWRGSSCNQVPPFTRFLSRPPPPPLLLKLDHWEYWWFTLNRFQSRFTFA